MYVSSQLKTIRSPNWQNEMAYEKGSFHIERRGGRLLLVSIDLSLNEEVVVDRRMGWSQRTDVVGMKSGGPTLNLLYTVRSSDFKPEFVNRLDRGPLMEGSTFY